MPFLMLITWMEIYRRKTLLAHHPMIVIVSRYNLAGNCSMENPDQRELVLISLCEIPSLYFPKESVTYISDLVVI